MEHLSVILNNAPVYCINVTTDSNKCWCMIRWPTVVHEASSSPLTVHISILFDCKDRFFVMIKSIVTCMILCAPRVPNFSEVQRIFLYFVWFSLRSDLNIQPISVCDISNERKQISDQFYNLLFLSKGYTFRVMIDLIYW